MYASKYLSKVTGICLIIVSVAILVNMDQFRTLVHHLIYDAPLMFIAGIFTLILGTLMVVSHNIWERDWRILITIIAWIIFLKGASILFYPQFIDKTSILFLKNIHMAYITAGFELALGVLLSYLGFRK